MPPPIAQCLIGKIKKITKAYSTRKQFQSLDMVFADLYHKQTCLRSVKNLYKTTAKFLFYLTCFIVIGHLTVCNLLDNDK